MGGRGSASHLHGGGGVFGRDPDRSGYREFTSQYEAEQWHLRNNFDMDTWNRLLTLAEREGIQAYTGSWYVEMNTSLREGYTPSLDVQERINGATSGLAKWTVREPFITYRGGNLHWTANLLGGIEAQMSDPRFLRSKIGKEVTDKGFMSSGTHHDSAWYADVDYTILNNRGIKGMYVDPISRNRGEYEFLYNRDTTFVVRQIRTDSSGRIVELVLEAVRSKH